MSRRLTRIEGRALGDHTYLTAEDECYHIYEYTSGRGWSFGDNNLINNLKKPLTRPAAELKFKDRAIEQCARDFRAAIPEDFLLQATFVPVPPSKARTHKDHDPRMLKSLKAVHAKIDVRELVIQRESVAAAHECLPGARPRIEDYLKIYAIDEKLAQPTPKAIAIVDDVLTTGRHFRAMTSCLNGRFPDVGVVGFFVARRVFPTEGPAEPNE